MGPSKAKNARISVKPAQKIDLGLKSEPMKKINCVPSPLIVLEDSSEEEGTLVSSSEEEVFGVYNDQDDTLYDSSISIESRKSHNSDSIYTLPRTNEEAMAWKIRVDNCGLELASSSTFTQQEDISCFHVRESYIHDTPLVDSDNESWDDGNLGDDSESDSLSSYSP